MLFNADYLYYELLLIFDLVSTHWLARNNNNFSIAKWAKPKTSFEQNLVLVLYIVQLVVSFEH